MEQAEHSSLEAECSTRSLEVGEELFATATQARVWFLLEYEGAWERKAFEASHIPALVKDYLNDALKRIPGSRLQLIKGHGGTAQACITFFTSRACEQQPALYEFRLQSYEDLLGLDLSDLAAGAAAFEGQRRRQPLFLVCTNGRRDPCCARLGTPFYVGLERIAADAVWRTTHVGGHRFAANALCFPHGLSYGRLHPEDAADLAASYRRGEILLERYRGRVCYAEPVQAAEYYLRLKTAALGVEDFVFEDLQESQPDAWLATFRSPDGAAHQVKVRRELSGQETYTSCHLGKLEPVAFYRLDGYVRKRR